MSALLNPLMLAPLVEMIRKAVADGVVEGMERAAQAQKIREAAKEKKHAG